LSPCCWWWCCCLGLIMHYCLRVLLTCLFECVCADTITLLMVRLHCVVVVVVFVLVLHYTHVCV
jgi:hypothetical protein